MERNFSIINKFQVIIAISFFIAFCFYFIPSGNHAIRIHDTFDGNFSTRDVLIKSGHFWDKDPTAKVPGIMNGLPRGVFPKFTELIGLMMYLFGSLNGFAITFLIARIIGFFGIYLFGRDHLKILPEQKGLLILLAVAFACLPLFVVQGVTVTGIPLLLWAFYNLIKKEKIKSSIVIFIIFGLWSQLVLVGFHIILILGILAVYYSIKTKKILWIPFISLMILAFTYISADYMLFYLHGIAKGFESSRGSFEKELSLNFKGVIGGTVTSFFTGDFSTANYFGYIFLPFVLYYLFLRFKEKENDSFNFGVIFFCVVLVSSFLINLLDWKGFAFFYEKFSFANTFNFKRFTNILPGFFFIMLSIMVFKITAQYKKSSFVFSSLFILTLLVFIWRGNISYNNSGFNNIGIKIEKEEVVTFNQFFDPRLYHEIKMEMGKDSITNLIHFGLSPSPSKYAGIPVLDDYQGDYQKAYKIEFRKIIEKELNKSKKLEKYFDEWGSRCYLYSAKTFENKLELKNGMSYQPELSINTSQLKAMNCRYILSTVIIGNSVELKLALQKVMVSNVDRKKILLYKIIS